MKQERLSYRNQDDFVFCFLENLVYSSKKEPAYIFLNVYNNFAIIYQLC